MKPENQELEIIIQPVHGEPQTFNLKLGEKEKIRIFLREKREEKPEYIVIREEKKEEEPISILDLIMMSYWSLVLLGFLGLLIWAACAVIF